MVGQQQLPLLRVAAARKSIRHTHYSPPLPSPSPPPHPPAPSPSSLPPLTNTPPRPFADDHINHLLGMVGLHRHHRPLLAAVPSQRNLSQVYNKQLTLSIIPSKQTVGFNSAVPCN